MIVVVTGSSGFIGVHLVQHLLASGSTVRALVRPQSSHNNRNKRVEYFEVDLLNADAVASSSAWDGATVLFHLAGVTKAPSLQQFRLGNVQPLANILSALSVRQTPPRIVVVSSQAAAGPARSFAEPVLETDEAAPIESYGVSKHEAEVLAKSYTNSLPITIVRPPAVYGPGDADFYEAFRQATSSYSLYVVNPEHWFDVVYVLDVVVALALAAQSASAIGKTYFLSGDNPIRWRDLYQLAARAGQVDPTQSRVPPRLLRIAARLGDLYGLVTGRTPLVNSQKLSLTQPAFWLCSSQRIRDELGWRPEMTVQKGVRLTYLWYVDAGWLSRKQGVPPTL